MSSLKYYSNDVEDKINALNIKKYDSPDARVQVKYSHSGFGSIALKH